MAAASGVPECGTAASFETNTTRSCRFASIPGNEPLRAPTVSVPFASSQASGIVANCPCS